MKTLKFMLLFFSALLIVACNLAPLSRNLKTITPSNTIITQDRSVSGFTGLDMSTFGKVVITQGDTESLTIKGSDNIVPLVESTVSGGVLTLRLPENVNFTSIKSENILTFTITVKDLKKLTLSGLGDVSMDKLTTQTLDITMSGAGPLKLDNLTADSLDVTLSGLGNVDLAGETGTAKFDLSGAGSINAPDLKIKTANIDVSGLGSATLWVTDRLDGSISGAGSVSYYGSPQTSTDAKGLGSFKALGSK